MFKKVKKFITLGLSVVTLGGAISPLVSTASVHAEIVNTEKINTRTLSEYEVKLIDKYILIENGLFKLNENNNLSPELKYHATRHIEQTNALIKQHDGNLYIDQKTKTIKSVSSLLRAPGKNGAEHHWNYIRYYIDAPTIRLLGAGMIGGSTAGLGAAIKTMGLSILLGVVSAMIGQKLSEVEDGIWFDYNVFFRMVTAAGFQ